MTTDPLSEDLRRLSEAVLRHRDRQRVNWHQSGDRGKSACLDPATITGPDGEPAFKTFADRVELPAWRSAQEFPPGTWDRAPRSDSTEDATAAEQGLPGVPVHPTPFQAVTDGFSQTQETR